VARRRRPSPRRRRPTRWPPVRISGRSPRTAWGRLRPGARASRPPTR
jgi:hypothetical protein